jgi:hypothetical protein
MPSSQISGLVSQKLALDSIGTINASAYELNGVPFLQSAVNMSVPNLVATGAAGAATVLNGTFFNTWNQFYTNNSGALMIPAGAVIMLGPTNYSSSLNVIAANWKFLSGTNSFYASTNFSGPYSLVPGLDGFPTNQPMVSIYTPVSGLTTNLQFVDATVIGGVLVGSRTNTLYFTNGILQGVTSP